MMNNEQLVSIITPMYNAQKYILETINSVINQTYKNWEMIIVDNCSTDNSREIVEKINDTRIKLIKLDYNSGGPARPRNIGLKNSNGGYIAFLDADDTWMSNKLEKQLNVLIDSQYSFCYSNYYNSINDKLEKAHSSVQPSGDIFKYQISNYTVGLLSVMFRKKSLDSMDGKFSNDYNYPGDFDFFIRVLEKNKAVYINDCLCTYRHDNPNSISNVKAKDNFEELKDLILIYRQKYVKKDILLEIDKLEMKTILKESDYYMQENMYSKARSVLKPYVNISNKLKIYYFLSFFGFKTIKLLRYININIQHIRMKI